MSVARHERAVASTTIASAFCTRCRRAM